MGQLGTLADDVEAEVVRLVHRASSCSRNPANRLPLGGDAVALAGTTDCGLSASD